MASVLVEKRWIVLARAGARQFLSELFRRRVQQADRDDALFALPPRTPRPVTQSIFVR